MTFEEMKQVCDHQLTTIGSTPTKQELKERVALLEERVRFLEAALENSKIHLNITGKVEYPLDEETFYRV